MTKSWTHSLNLVCQWIAESALLLLLVVICYAVLARYLFNSPSVHAVEISAYLLAVMIWFSAGWAHIEGRHVSLEHFKGKESGVMRRISTIVSEVSVLIFCLTLLYAGVVSVLTAYEKGYKSATLLAFPQWLLLLLIPLGAIGLGVVAAARCRVLFSARDAR